MRRALPIVLLVLGVSCGGDSPKSAPSPSRSATTASPTRSGTPLKSGTASVVMSGPNSATMTLNIDPARSELSLPPGTFKLIWQDGRGNVLAIGGATFSGTRTTAGSGAGSLIVSFGFTQGSTQAAFASLEGECSITMNASATKVAGSLVCERIKPVSGGSGTYRLTGTFSATT